MCMYRSKIWTVHTFMCTMEADDKEWKAEVIIH